MPETGSKTGKQNAVSGHVKRRKGCMSDCSLLGTKYPCLEVSR